MLRYLLIALVIFSSLISVGCHYDPNPSVVYGIVKTVIPIYDTDHVELKACSVLVQINSVVWLYIDDGSQAIPQAKRLRCAALHVNDPLVIETRQLKDGSKELCWEGIELKRAYTPIQVLTTSMDFSVDVFLFI